MGEFLSDFWPYVATAVYLAVGACASAHAVLDKEDERAAIGWVGVIWLAPLVGALLYVAFGINRIRRRARVLRAIPPVLAPSGKPLAVTAERLRDGLSHDGVHLQSLVRLVGLVTERPLLPGNRIVPLWGGDEAYPQMLDAIGQAERSIALSTYIFDNDPAGHQFLDALREAMGRGVEVRVLIDDVGTRYTWPPMVRVLRQAGLWAVTFNPSWTPSKFHYSNLRNHRKILVIDGRLGFTGGMNIREGHLLSRSPRHAVRDLHFRIEGPVVRHLQEIFAVDWAFSADELLQDERWFPPLAAVGPALARGIADGPDDDDDMLRLTILGALAVARESVLIVTPYFLPDRTLITALSVAAMRGVDVDILLPAENNLTLVAWASTAALPELIEHGCRVWLTPPPFDHTKLMLVDGAWTLFGSANWDPRSLRLNFEFNVECYDRALAAQLGDCVRATRQASQPVTLEELRQRPLLYRLRDGIAHLASPYL